MKNSDMERREYNVVVLDAQEKTRREYVVSALSEDDAIDNWNNPRYSMMQQRQVVSPVVSEVSAKLA